MKYLIQKLQQYPKAWGKFKEEFYNIGFYFDKFNSIHFVGDDMGEFIKISDLENNERYWNIIGEFLNSFIESEGYYMMLSTNIFGDNKSPYSCNVKKLNRLQWEVRGFGETPAEAKQSAIIEAFKLIEQGL